MTFRAFFTFLVVFYLGGGCAKKNGESAVVARVGKEVLTLEMIERAIPAEYTGKIDEIEKKDYVLRWINNEVLYREALRNNLDEDSRLQEELEQFKKEYMINRLLEMKVDKAISVSPEEIGKYYQRHKDDFIRGEEEVRLIHILAKTLAQARAIRQELTKGHSVGEIVQKQNLHLSLMGYWDTGYITKKEIAFPIAEKAFKMKVGAISRPIKTEFGYHVVKLLDKKGRGTLRDLDLVRGEIEARLKADKRRKLYSKLLSDLRNKADLWMNLKVIEETHRDSSAAKQTEKTK